MTIMDVSKLPTPVAKRLREFYRSRRLHEFLRVVLSAGAAYLLLALVVMHLDRFLFLETDTRVLLSAIVHCVGGVYALVLFLIMLIKRTTAKRLAYELERQLSPEVAERYVTLADLMASEEHENASPIHEDLLQQLKRETIAHSTTFAAGGLVVDRRFRVMCAVAFCMLGLYALLLIPSAYQMPLMMHRFLAPSTNLPKPSFVHLSLSPASPVIGRGGEIVMQARIEGEIPYMLKWLFNLLGAPSGQCFLIVEDEVGVETVHMMNRIQRTLFVFSRTDIQNSFGFTMRCADAQTARHLLEVVPQPVVMEVKVTVTPPEYTRLPVTTVTNMTAALRVYEGSTVSTVFRVDQRVPSRIIRVNGMEATGLSWDENTREGMYVFTCSADTELDIRVANDRGFENVERVRVALRVREDQKPAVRLNYPASDVSCVPGEFVPMQLSVEDDLGVDNVFVQYYLNPELDADAAPREWELDLTAKGERKVQLSTMLDLDKTGAVPGDNLLVLVRARDTAGNDGESRPVDIRVVAFARGENERRRLDVLDFVGMALLRLADNSGVTPEDPMDIPPEIYTEILRVADASGIPLATPPSYRSILALLEQEHHFTDLSRHKEDVRMVYGLVRDAVSLREKGECQNQLRQVAEELVLSLTLYRRSKTVAWQLYGLKYELDWIEVKLEAAMSRREAMVKARVARLNAFFAEVVATTRTDGEVVGIRKQRETLETELTELRAELEALRKTIPVGMGGGMGKTGASESKEMREVREDISIVHEEIQALDAKIAIRVGTVVWTALWSRDLADVFPKGLNTKEVQKLLGNVCREALLDDAPASEISSPHIERLMSRMRVGKESDEVVLKRRTSLYMETVEDVGANLLALAKAVPRLDDSIVLQRQDALVSSAYLISGEGKTLEQRALSMTDIRAGIDGLMEVLVPVLPELSTIENNVRGRLQNAFAGVLARMAADSGKPDTSKAWHGNAVQWVRADMRAMGYNTFAPLGSYIRDLNLLTCLRDRKVFQEGVTPLSSALAELQKRADVLSFSWELADLLAMERVSTSEKLLASRLIGMEASQRFEISTNTRYQIEFPVKDSNATDLPAALSDVCSEDLSLEHWLSSEAMLTAALRAVPGIVATTNCFLNLTATLRDDDPGFGRIQDAFTQGEGQPVAFIRDLLQGSLERVARVDDLILLLRLKLAYLPDEGQGDTLDVLFLRTRQSMGRFRSRTVESVSELEALAMKTELSAADLTTAGRYLAVLGREYASLQKNLMGLRDELVSGTITEQKTLDKYPLLRRFGETQKMTAMAIEASTVKQPGAVAIRFMNAFPEALTDYITSQRASLVTAKEALERCRVELSRETPELSDYHADLAIVLDALRIFQDALSIIKDNEASDKLAGGVTEVANRAEGLRIESSADDVEVRQRQFEIGETVKHAQQVIRMLDSLSTARQERDMHFNGGPDNIWSQAQRNSANHSRHRIETQSDFARRTTTLGVLSSLKKVDADRLLSARSWSMFEYRLVRSPLTGPVVTRPPEVTATESEDPLTRWLLDQLLEARKEARREGNLMYYRESTLEWIDVMRDFLRY